MPDLPTTLKNAGVPLAALKQDEREVALTWDPATVGPIFKDEVLVILPDMHLASGDAGDIFRGFDGKSLTQLERLLTALIEAKTQLPRLSVVHLGDLYDVWRAYPQYRDHPTSDYRIIENAYGRALGMLVQDLGARVCVGNHDACLALFPPSWARTPNGVTQQLAYGHVFSEGRVLAFHGHQADRIDNAMASHGGSALVQIATEVAKLSNPLSQALQIGIDVLADFFGDSGISLTDALNTRWHGVDPPADAHGFVATRWCDRAGRENIQKVAGALPNASDLRLVIVGHSHIPGISAIHVPVPGRLVPLIDVGSWVWGRSQLAIAREGEIKLWTLT